MFGLHCIFVFEIVKTVTLNTMLSRPITLVAALLAALCACTSDHVLQPQRNLDSELMKALAKASPTGSASAYLLPHEDQFEDLPNADLANPVTPEKVALGKFLFFETGLAQSPLSDECKETYSCSSCHIPSKGFLPGRLQGIADGAFGFGLEGEGRQILHSYQDTDLDAQGIRPLTVMNVAYMTNTLWSGLFGSGGVNQGTEDLWVGDLAYVNKFGYTGLESQNIEGLHLHRMKINDHVLDDYGYRDLFDRAFPDLEENERYSDITASFALGAYLRTIITNEAPFQKWLSGDYSKMSSHQKEGALVFFGKARCYKCHKSPSFSSVEFHALGTKDLFEMGGVNTSDEDPRNLGRGMFTGKEGDNYRFKVPQLYNLKDYATYFHGSSKISLEEVIEFKDKAASENSKISTEGLSPLFIPLNLTKEEKAQLVDFLKNALHDPNMERYVPSTLPSGHCFPNNDEKSKIDLGCE